MKVPTTFETGGSDAEKWPRLRRVYELVAKTVNYGISFGDGTQSDNIDGIWANVVTPGAPNTDFTVTHNLGRIPVAYFVATKAAACDIYTGSVASTTTTLTLRGTVAGIAVRLFIA